MSTDKWDGLLDEGTPETPEPRHNTAQERRRPGAQYNWSRIFLALATIILAAGVIIWWWTRTPSGDTTSPQTPATATVEPTSQPTWSYVEEATPDPQARDEAASTVTEFIHAFCERENSGDWWDTDEAIKDLTSEQLRYEFTEYTELATDGIKDGETVTEVAYTNVDDQPVGYWSATATITMDTGRTITAEISAQAVENGWHITEWEVTK